MFQRNIRLLIVLLLGPILLAASTSPASIQNKTEGLALKHPEVEGIYEMKVGESQNVVLQVYFKVV